MKPVQPDDTLAKIVGSKPIPRSEVTKKIWDYIKKNKLQDEKKKTLGGIQLIKIWLESSDKEQKRRFEARMTDPLRQWKLNPMDLPSRTKWFEYSRARDLMLKATDTKHVPWHILRSDEKKSARLNCLHHILDLIPHKKVPREKVKLPKRSMKGAYDDEATVAHRKFIPEKY